MCTTICAEFWVLNTLKVANLSLHNTIISPLVSPLILVFMPHIFTVGKKPKKHHPSKECNVAHLSL